MKRIMIDAGKCDGCMNCTVACMQAHREDEGPVYTLDLTDPKNETRNFIKADGKGGYIPLFCRHCDAPECVMACMSGALYKDAESGHVQYDRGRCGTCYMCVMNCSYGIPKPDTLTRTHIVKCDFCVDDGADPNCVRSCPKDAIFVEEV